MKTQKNDMIDKRNELNEKYKTLQEKIKDLDFARQTINDYLKNEKNEQNRSRSDLE